MSDLRSRAAAAAGKDVERVVQGPTLGQQIEEMKLQFQLAMPRGAEAAQLVRDAMTCLRTVRNLDRAEPKSVLGSLMTAAQLGLRPGVLGHCWPLPFWDKNLRVPGPDGKDRFGGYRAQLVIGYEGYVDLGYRSPMVSSIIGRTVYENDVFEVDEGTADSLIHKPLLDGDRGKPRAHYAIVKTNRGGHAFWWMTQQDVLKFREKYAPRNKDKAITGPWAAPDDSDEFKSMARKTCFRQLAKWMPKSTDLATAIEVDGAVRVDVTPDMPATEVSTHLGSEDDVVQGEMLPTHGDFDPTLDPNWGMGGDV